MKFIHLTDTHVIGDALLYGQDSAARLRAAVASINAEHVDAGFVVLTGDMTHWGDAAAYARLKYEIKKLKMPVHLTGKELVAQAIHRQSQRADREMLSVNCAAIPESLIEAELFGHVKGAFTGAASDRVGLIESADQSTLFLDEIGELPLEAQSRLLRVLQEGEIRRVGSTERTYVDVRLIAATHRNLLEMVSKGQFREDLYYRLNVIELRCPPLRERGEDILLLAEFFLNAIQTQMARPELRFSQDTQQAIQQHHWPGNVRELANVIERAVVLCEGPLIDALDLSLQSHGSNPPQFSAGEQRRPSENRPMMSLEDYFQHFVLSHEEQMSETELAKRLGISRKSLWERRNRLGIPRRKDEEND